MATSSYATPLTGLLIFLCAITASTAVRDAKPWDLDVHFDVNKVCSLVKDKKYCENVLVSYPGIFDHIDYKEVGVIFVLETTYRATDAKNTIMDLFPESRGAQRVHLKFCQQIYDSFLQKDRKILSQLLGKKDYIGLHREASVFAKYTSDCEESFKPAPSPLTLRNNNFYNSIDMLSAYAYVLIHQ
ncbi:hypothetical protein MKX03_035745 [Papaver bracteatum]|nr:hypothetical protein MKX03_035745 [Papaver bracteatum]